jgi:hypothetical protein
MNGCVSSIKLLSALSHLGERAKRGHCTQATINVCYKVPVAYRNSHVAKHHPSQLAYMLTIATSLNKDPASEELLSFSLFSSLEHTQPQRAPT